MRSTTVQKAIYAAAFVALASAQQSSIVPQDLSGSFDDSGNEMQVSYTDEAVNGFTDGTEFSPDEVQNAPTFALGDSNGIVTSRLYTILMVDTTCDSARTLHFAQSNFKFDFDITNLRTSSEPLLDYKAPGSFQETGDDRKYSFLMYNNPGNDNITELSLPEEGATFDVKQFQDDNDFDDPVGGVGMVVKLGGSSNCEGGSGNEEGGSSSAAPESSAAAPASSAAPSTSSAAGPSSAAASPTSRAGSATTASAQEPQSTSGSDEDEDEDTASSGGAASSTSGPAGASSAVESAAASASSAVESAAASASSAAAGSLVPDASGTTTGSPAVQTDSGVSALSLATARSVVLASLVTFAALIAF